MEDISEIAAAMGRIPSGLFIITSVWNGKSEGYLGSWVQQASFSPFMVNIAIRPGRPCYEAIKAHGRFCITIVGQKNGGMMKPFWNPDTVPDPFAGLESVLTSRGNILLKSGVAALECEARTSMTPGDHEIVFAEVVQGHLIQQDDKPLTHVRKSGLGY